MNTAVTNATKPTVPAQATDVEDLVKLLKQYGCGPVQFTGADGLYERHLTFDNVKDPDGDRRARTL